MFYRFKYPELFRAAQDGGEAGRNQIYLVFKFYYALAKFIGNKMWKSNTLMNEWIHFNDFLPAQIIETYTFVFQISHLLCILINLLNNRFLVPFSRSSDKEFEYVRQVISSEVTAFNPAVYLNQLLITRRIEHLVRNNTDESL